MCASPFLGGVVGTAGGGCAFRVLVVQDFEGVTVEDGDDERPVKSAARERLAASKLPKTMARCVCKKQRHRETAILLAGGEDGEAPVASPTLRAPHP